MSEEIDFKKIQLIMSLRNRGVVDRRVLSAMELVPRELFVPNTYKDQAYADQALPIDCGQTISQPFVVGFMTDKLNIGERDKVLEIGTGSGYQTAVLARLCRRVYTIERYRTLSRQAQAIFDAQRITNITSMVGDGVKGWPQQAPFDRIIVTAAAQEVPDALIDQLKIGGVMILPLSASENGVVQNHEKLCKVIKTENDIKIEELIDVRFVPIIPGIAREM
ncbi:MAG: protein-L-isoaspartate(D-aspartate) O-methyltransferase [Hyphomicrobiales bacterium]